MKRLPRLADLRRFSFCLPVTAGLFIASCATKPPPPPPPAPDAPKPLYDWHTKGRSVSHMRINIDEQKVYVFSGNDEIAWSTVATGLRSFPTPTGSFKVLEKTANKKSNLYGKTYNAAGKLVNSDAKMGRDAIPEGGKFTGATMPYYLRLTGDGVGMHAGPIPRPGSRASHGCIRMPRAFAPMLFSQVSIGTPVDIVGDGPAYGSYIKAQQAAAARLYAKRKKAAAEAAAKTAAEGAPATPPPAEGSAPTAATPPATTPATAPTPAATTPVPLIEPKLEIKPAELPNQ